MNDGCFVGVLEGSEFGCLVDVDDDGVDGEIGGWGEEGEGDEERSADDEPLRKEGDRKKKRRSQLEESMPKECIGGEKWDKEEEELKEKEWREGTNRRRDVERERSKLGSVIFCSNVKSEA